MRLLRLVWLAGGGGGGAVGGGGGIGAVGGGGIIGNSGDDGVSIRNKISHSTLDRGPSRPVDRVERGRGEEFGVVG